MIRNAAILLVILLAVTPTLAMESTSYQITDQTFNSGGDLLLTSSSYQITLTSLGDGVAEVGLASPSYQMDGSFAVGYPPPGEVANLTFVGPDTLVWDPARSSGDYNLYRDVLSNLTSLGYGACEQQNLVDATATDSDPVSAGSGYFYLVTVNNRLGEEGTKGADSSDLAREGNVCP
jgi:hypothetical protein